jgi:hypothetical protein
MRVTSKRIESKSLQGEGSYIIIKRVGWKQAKDVNKYLGVGDVSLRADMTSEEKAKHIDKEVALTEDILCNAVVEWNWTDDQGNPLPVPRKPADLDLLLAEEVQFILDAALDRLEEPKKNSETGSSTTSGSAEQTTPPPTSG